jgi:hypothetical protein
MPNLKTDPRAEKSQELWQRWRDARSSWDTEARSDIDFYSGNHYTTNESDDLSSVNQAAVPMDRIGPAVEKLKSIITATPPAFTVIPREDSDAKLSKIWRVILGYCWELSSGDMHMKQAIHDYAVTGLGYLYAYLDSESDFGRGDIKFTSVNPFRVYVPPSSRDRFFDDADSIILSTILTEEQVLRLYPELGPQLDPETGEMTEGLIKDISTHFDEDYPSAQNKNSVYTVYPDASRDLDYGESEYYQILERFYKTKVPFYRIVDVRTQEEQVLSEPEFQLFLSENPDVFESGLMEYAEVLQNRVGVIASVGEIVLYESILNIEIYPIIPLPNVYTGTPYPRSDVSRARPMQRLLNKLWSLAISHAQASAGLKLLVPLGSVENIGDLERDWANPNAVIEVDSSQGEPHYPSPTPLAAEFYRLIQTAEHYIDFTFGLPELMHGFSEEAPDTVRGTEKMISLGAERPKSKLRDIEFGISRLGRVMYGLGKSHYSYQKMFRLAQPNNDLSEVTVNLYDDVSGTLMDIAKDKYNVNQHDVTIAPGSTLPTSKWAEYNVYLEAFQLGIVDREEVLKKNPEIFDKEGILQRTGEIQQLQGMVQQLEGQVKDLQGDLQTARRESVADRKRVEVEKFKSKLSNVESDAKATNKVQAEKLAGAVKLAAEKSKNMMGSAQEAGETL